jgi:hypothetical protein
MSNDCFFTVLNGDVSSYVGIRINDDNDSGSENNTKSKTVNIACYSFINRKASFSFDNVDLSFRVTWEGCSGSKELESRVNESAKVLSKPLKSLKEKIKDNERIKELKDDIVKRVRERLIREYLLENIDKGDKDTQYEYALMCYEGKGGGKDFFASRKYFKLAAQQGHARSQLKYAYMCLEGLAGDQNNFIFREYIKKSADNGDLEAQGKYKMLCEKDKNLA